MGLPVSGGILSNIIANDPAFTVETPDWLERLYNPMLGWADSMRVDRPGCFPGHLHELDPRAVRTCRASSGGGTSGCLKCGVPIYIPPAT